MTESQRFISFFLFPTVNALRWVTVQAVIEEAILLQKDIAGFVSDIVKAFEFFPESPSCG